MGRGRWGGGGREGGLGVIKVIQLLQAVHPPAAILQSACVGCDVMQSQAPETMQIGATQGRNGSSILLIEGPRCWCTWLASESACPALQAGRHAMPYAHPPAARTMHRHSAVASLQNAPQSLLIKNSICRQHPHLHQFT